MIGSQVVPNHDLYVQPFTCGCLWRWWVGEVSTKNHRWEKQCVMHAAQARPVRQVAGMLEVCTCLNIGLDDGATTCWQHHDCWSSACTHMDVDEPALMEEYDV